MSLLETLVAELERPREITAQVTHHLVETYGITRDAIGSFLEQELSGCEEFEIDLIFSPLFTPTLRDQAIFAEVLGRDSIAFSNQRELIQELVRRPTRGQFRTEDGVRHPAILREVTIERFVERLRLEGTMPAELLTLIESLPEAERSLWKAVARRAIWENPKRREILSRYLGANGSETTSAAAVALVKLVESHEPAEVAALLAQIPHWQQVLRQEINDSGARPFFNERVEELHGGGRDQRRSGPSRQSEYEQELAFLNQLQAGLAP